MKTELAPSTDLGTGAVIAACVIAAIGVALLIIEIRRSEARGRGAVIVAATGILAALALVGAVLRPVSVETDGISVGARVLVLMDDSRSMDLPALSEGGDAKKSAARRVVALTAAKALAARSADARFAFGAFGSGPATSVDVATLENGAAFGPRKANTSDLVAALEAVSSGAEEPPSAIVVISDGRLDRPTAEHAGEESSLGLGALGVPVSTVHLGTASPKDASVRSVHVAGAAVAHQPLSLRVEVGCSGGLKCDKIPVVARELVDDGPAEILARGEADVPLDATETVELSITLNRAGPRVIEVSIESPHGDAIEDNDRRFVTLDVARDRVRVLHIAGRPTYDVRALRMWLKSDASVDVVAFFILRTPTDNVGASPSELALIPFPVDELFTVHLPSFDAVVLQDFNADLYGLAKHLGTLTEYVHKGGGLIMVGGPDAFGPGRYAGTPISDALPVKLGAAEAANGIDLGWFKPDLTPAGHVAPVLAPLRDVIGDVFPDMPGTNVVGDANPGATVLLTHPTLKTSSGAPMPVLALGEYGTGRTIALTVDGSHRLLFSSFAAEQAGRAHGAFWDGLLGWLMRDPRFESTVVELPNGCVAGEPNDLLLRPLPGTEGDATVVVTALGTGARVFEKTTPLDGPGKPTKVTLPSLDPGGYSASVQIGKGSAEERALTPATRRDFACETGGDEWADPRPDADRLAAIAKATGGIAVAAADVDKLELPLPTRISTEQKTRPVLPPWAWTTIAACLVGAHWFTRRKSGLS